MKRKENLIQVRGRNKIIQMCVCARAQSLSRGRHFETMWTVAHQAPQFMEFSRKEKYI